MARPPPPIQIGAGREIRPKLASSGGGVGVVLYGGKSIKEQTLKCEAMTSFLSIKTLEEKR